MWGSLLYAKPLGLCAVFKSLKVYLNECRIFLKKFLQKSSVVWKALNSISVSLATTQWYHHSESGVWVLKEAEKTIRVEIIGIWYLSLQPNGKANGYINKVAAAVLL